MSNTRLVIPSDKVLNNTDFAWLYRLINMKLSDRSISPSEENELRQLQSKMWALDQATASRRVTGE